MSIPLKNGNRVGRVGRCVARYREPQKVLPKSFYLRLPKIAPFAINNGLTVWRKGQFSGAQQTVLQHISARKAG